jgi:hypothetical protein
MRRRAIVLLAAVVPLAAVIIAVAAAGGGSSKTPARLPIAAGSAAGSGSPKTAAAQADLARYSYQETRYEAAAGLPELDGKGHAYSIGGGPTQSDVRALAAALGVAGDVVQETDGSYVVGTDDRRLYVQRQGGAAWYLSSSKGAVDAISASGICSADGVCSAEPIPPPQRPVGLPTEQEAKAKALEVLRSTGMDVDHANVSVDDLTTAWQVRVDPIVDGLATEGFGATVTVTEDGIDYGNGYLGTAKQADEYPLIGTRAAIEVLNTTGGMNYLQGGGDPKPAIAIDQAPATMVCVTTPCEEPPITSLPVRVVTITGATPVLLLAPSYDATTAYLVPAYRFATDEDGGSVVSFAIDASWFASPAPYLGSDAPEAVPGIGSGSGSADPTSSAGAIEPGRSVVPCTTTPDQPNTGVCSAGPIGSTGSGAATTEMTPPPR